MGRVLLFDSDSQHAIGVADALRGRVGRLIVCSALDDALATLRKQPCDLLIYAADPTTEWKASMEIVRWMISQLQEPPELLCLLPGPRRGPDERVYAAQRRFGVVYES